MKIGQETANLLEACKPYKGGNDTLWLISELNNIDKHRLLFTVGTFLDKLLVRVDWSDMQMIAPEIPTELLGGPDQPPFTFDIRGTKRGFHEGDVVFYTPGNRVNDKNLELTVNVSLGESQVPEGESLLMTLQGMLKLVDNLVSNFASVLGCH